MTAADHILVVDDHPDIRSSLAAYLRRQGLAVTTASDAAQAGTLLLKQRFDLIVLDVMMPGEDGLSLCRRVTRTLDTPVILLTAMHTCADKVAGLDSGADDYVVKPFDPPELVARIRTVLRRSRRPAAQAAKGTSPAGGYAFGGWFLDTGKHELFDPEGAPAALSSAEYRLLRVLVEHPGTVLSRDRLMDLTGGGDALAFDRSIDSQVSRLRKKLETDPRRPSLLKTVWGNGYLFAATVTPCPAAPQLAAS